MMILTNSKTIARDLPSESTMMLHTAEFYNTDKFSNVTIILRVPRLLGAGLVRTDPEIFAHKQILYMHSNHFRFLLSDDCDHQEIVLRHESIQAMQFLLMAIYQVPDEVIITSLFPESRPLELIDIYHILDCYSKYGQYISDRTVQLLFDLLLISVDTQNTIYSILQLDVSRVLVNEPLFRQLQWRMTPFTELIMCKIDDHFIVADERFIIKTIASNKNVTLVDNKLVMLDRFGYVALNLENGIKSKCFQQPGIGISKIMNMNKYDEMLLLREAGYVSQNSKMYIANKRTGLCKELAIKQHQSSKIFSTNVLWISQNNLISYSHIDYSSKSCYVYHEIDMCKYWIGKYDLFQFGSYKNGADGVAFVVSSIPVGDTYTGCIFASYKMLNLETLVETEIPDEFLQEYAMSDPSVKMRFSCYCQTFVVLAQNRVIVYDMHFQIVTEIQLTGTVRSICYSSNKVDKVMLVVVTEIEKKRSINVYDTNQYNLLWTLQI